LADAPRVLLDQPDKNAGYASRRFNLQPPFEDPAPRRAVLKAVQQSDF
jgi:peptide/nickel transport system substrate-binding protein